jgi:hypothetical protein
MDERMRGTTIRIRAVSGRPVQLVRDPMVVLAGSVPLAMFGA